MAGARSDSLRGDADGRALRTLVDPAFSVGNRREVDFKAWYALGIAPPVAG